MEIVEHPDFQEFLTGVRDKTAKAKIFLAMQRLRAGKFGNSKSVGEGVMEARIDYGPGWRVYYTQVGKQILMLLTGGTKNGQQKDIDTAKRLARELRK